MIVRMKKISLLIYHSSRNKFMSALQSLGVVHLAADKAVQNEEIIKLKDYASRLKKNEKLLAEIQKKFKKKMKQADYRENAAYMMDKVEDIYNNLEKAKIELENVYRERDLLEPWGYFNPDIITALENKGIKMKFYSLKAAKFKKISFVNIAYEIISKRKGKVHFAVFYHRDDAVPEFDIPEIRIPMKNKQDIDKLKYKYEDEVQNLTYALYEYSRFISLFKKETQIIGDKLEYSIADANLTEEVNGKVMLITGWLPKNKVKNAEKFLADQDAYFLIEDPVKTDNVPVLLKNNPFAKLFEPILGMHSLPAYTEIDPTPFFAPFFAAFFGLCLADIGYGLVLLILAAGFFVLTRSKKTFPFFILGVILSLFTMAGGLILNSFFGSQVLTNSIFPEAMKKFVYFSNMNDQMLLALSIGVVQVILGLILQIVNRFKSCGWQGIFQPIGIILVIVGSVLYGVAFYAQGDMSVGPIPVKKFFLMIPNLMQVILVLLITGTFFILFFNNVDKKVFTRPARGLWEIYGIVSGLLGDILSYIRLFALGLSSSLLGTSFNQIAFMVRDGATGPLMPVGYAGMIIIMLLGHSLNFGLGALGSFVHPLRLTLLEFYKYVGFTGGGTPYSPFKYRIKIKEKN